jgi:glycosyltransferase involved in cell wall biosynthesis
MHTVSCIIPVRNGADTIERAVKSAFEAGCINAYAFNDGSNDSTGQILKKIFNDLLRHDILQFISYSNSGEYRCGVNYARNTLVEEVGGGLIIPLDADDELLDITPFIEAYQPDTWVYGDYIECDGKYETYIKGAPAGSLARKNITGVTFLYSVESWYKAGGYDPDFAYAEDYAFQCALVNAGVRPVYVPKPLYRRHLRPEGNERTVLAGHYWNFYAQMARAKYPAVFINQ